MLTGMLNAWKEHQSKPLDHKLCEVWAATWPFTYNATVLDLAASFDLPVLMTAMKDLPEHVPHTFTRQEPKIPTDDDIDRIVIILATVGLDIEPDVVNLVLATAARLNLIKLPMENVK
jgi:hypothetical protein